jgi:hypothetical protein
MPKKDGISKLSCTVHTLQLKFKEVTNNAQQMTNNHPQNSKTECSYSLLFKMLSFQLKINRIAMPGRKMFPK